MFWFDEQYAHFQWFSLAHLIPFCLLACMIVVFKVFGKYFKGPVEQTVRRSLIVLTLAMEWTFYVWEVSRSGLSADLLPLGLCAVTLYLSCVMLWTKSRFLFRWIFVYAISGSMLSLIIVDMPYSWPHFRYFHYFGVHMFFLLACLYAWIVWGYRITHKHVLQASLILAIYAVVINQLNRLLATNHLFLQALPEEVAWLYLQIFDRFWVIGFAASIFFLFNVLYGLLAVIQKRMVIETVI
ncbi:MAG: TIGR02206 family membrane protein [Acholeplasmatales bacterium]|nr:MAG: TIGR02206 family membrane protein [Acholeplasmatales bacterium]